MIASIVVFYNPDEEELLHLNDYCEEVDCVIVIDNSSESSYGRLKNIINRTFEYRHHPENIGLCAALNVGIDIAANCGCDWALLMDADSSFKTNIMEVYMNTIRNIDEGVAVLSPVHIYDRSFAVPYNGTRKVKWAMTSGCLYRIDVFKKLGGFMEGFFVDGLDIEYCYRARENGYKIIECGQAVLNHHPADTKIVHLLWKKIKIGTASPWRYYMQARSLTYIILKYKHVSDVIMLTWKWVKAVLWLKPRKEYTSQMSKGMNDGRKLYRNKILT